MKATQRDFAAVAARVASSCAIWFFCGPDEAGSALACSRVIADLADAGERIDLSGSDLKSDSVRLVDEARSTSLFGGARHIVAQVNGDEGEKAVKAYLEMADLGEMQHACPVFILATGATDKSRTAKLLIDCKDGLVAMFHAPDINTVKQEIRLMLDGAGLRYPGDLLDRMAHAANMDLRIARSEVDKLALYCDASPQAPKQASLEAFEAICARTAEDDLPPIVNAVLGGEVRRLPGELQRIRELGINPVMIALALERRAAQLAGLAARMGPREDLSRFLEQQGVWRKDRRSIEEQLRRWPSHKLDRLVSRLTELHRALLGNSQTAELRLAQSLTQIARFAATNRR
ncbi:MAG: DNA polymerase III subunit delta [Alteraurantiacibacter sp.]